MLELIAAVVLAQATPAAASPSAAIDAALNAATLAGAHVGVLAVDAGTGNAIYERNAGDDFVPASTLKLLTGSAALEKLGPVFTFATEVDASGSVASGVLNGDLYLRGGGDVQLAPTDLDAAAAAVAAAGVQRVSGGLVADATRYRAQRVPAGWAVDDLPQGYGAIPGALGLDLNVAHVRVEPGAAVGAPVRLQYEVLPGDPFAIDNAAVTGAAQSADTTDVERPWDRPTTIRIVGSYPLAAAPSEDLEPAVPDPASYALAAFAAALARHGVSVAGAPHAGSVPSDATVLWTHHSELLPAVVADCWIPSTNVIAEQLLLELGRAYQTGPPPDGASSIPADTRDAGFDAERAYLKSIGVDPATVTLVDGSGLSAYDRVTPRALVAVLQSDWNGSQREAVLAALPVAGARGTLKSSFAGTPLQGIVWAKTGSENHARLLAGYLRPTGRDPIVFALMINDWMDTAPDASARLDAARAAVLQAILAAAR